MNALRSRLWLTLLLTLFAATACQRHGGSAEEGETLRVQHWGEPVSLDLSLAEDLLSLQILANIDDGLLGYDSAGKLELRLAESMDVSADRRTYTFRLRKEARWSDGQPIHAADFVYAFRRTLDPSLPSKFGLLFRMIKNVDQARAGKVAMDQIGVSASPMSEGREVLTITLESPVPYFPHALTFPMAFPQREDQTKLAPDKRVTSGVYSIVEHVNDQRYVLAVNPYSWRKALEPNRKLIPRVEMLILREDASAMNLFDQGRLHILGRVGLLDVKPLRDKGLLRNLPFHATYFLGFNTQKPPFNDRHWRRAVAGVIQKEQIVQALGGTDHPSLGFTAFGLEGALPWPGQVEYRKMFEDSIKAVKGRPKPARAIVIGYDANARNTLVLEKVQQDLKKDLGLEVKLESLDWKSHIRTMQAAPPEMFRFGWLTPFDDPMPFLEFALSDGLNNYGKFRNAKYDELVEKVRHLPSGPERARLIAQAERLLTVDEAGLVALYHYTQNQAVAADVEGYRVTPFGVIPFYELGLKSK